MKQQLQFFRAQADAGTLAGGPVECALFETLGANPQAAPIPKDQFDPVSQFVGEQENVAAERILREHRLYIGIEPVEGLAHVNRTQCDENTRRRRKAEHVQPRSSSARSRTASVSRQRTVRPDGPTTSIAQGLVGFVVGGSSLTSLNTTGIGRFEARFAFASHQLSVASGIPFCREKAARVRPLRRNCSTIRIR